MGVHGSAVSFCNPGQPYPRAPGLGSSVKWGEEIPRYSNLKSPLGGMNRCRGGVWFLGQVHGRWFPACGCSVSPAGQGLAGGLPEAPGWALRHAAGGAGGALGAPDAVVGTAALRGGRGSHCHHGLPLAGATCVRIDVPECSCEQGPNQEGTKGDTQYRGQDKAFTRQVRADDVQAHGDCLVDFLGQGARAQS